MEYQYQWKKIQTSIICSNICKNCADAVGSMYVSLHIDTDIETTEILCEDCFRFDNIKFVNNTAMVTGDEAFLNVTGGLHSVQDPNNVASNLCATPALCELFSSTLACLCVPEVSVDSGVCEKIYKNINDSADIKFSFLENSYMIIIYFRCWCLVGW